MIPIEKKAEPKALTKAKRDIKNTPDATFDFSSLRGSDKSEVLEALVREQGYLCAYCMCRIGVREHQATIEHLEPQHPSSAEPDGGLSLAYENMVAVCDGRNGATCDKHRGNAPLTVNPTKPHKLGSIVYRRDGRIDAGDEAIRRDLQETLGLNSPRTNLCANRAAAMREIEREIASVIRGRKIERNVDAKKNLCLKVLRYYEQQGDKKDEYLGAKLFKANRLVAKFTD